MRKTLLRLTMALLATLLCMPSIRADVGDTYKLVTSADQLEEGAHYLIGSKALSYVMSNQTAPITLGIFKNSYCMAAVKDIDLSSGQLTEQEGMGVIVLKKNGEKWQLINAANQDQGMYMYFVNSSGTASWQTTLLSSTPDNFSISVTDAGVATVSNGKSQSPELVAQNRGFVCGGGSAIELYKKETVATDPAAKPLLTVNGEESAGGTFTENSIIKVYSNKAKCLKVWTPGATEATEHPSIYSFPLTVSGIYKFQGVNDAGESEVLSATLTVGTPQLPVVIADGETVENNAEISVASLTVNSEYALLLTVGKPDGTTEEITSLPYIFTPKAAGNYTFTGKNTTQSSEVFSLNVKIPQFQLVKDVALMVPGTKFVVACKTPTNLTTSQIMTAESYTNLASANYKGLKGVDCAIDDNGVLTSPDGLLLTVTERDGKLYLMNGDKGLRFTYGASSGQQLTLSESPTPVAFESISDNGMNALVYDASTSSSNNYLRFDDQIYQGNKQSFFLPFAKAAWRNIQFYVPVNEGAAPEIPSVSVADNTLENNGVYTFTEGVNVQTASIGATSMEVTFPDGTKATADAPSYSFSLAQSGQYLFTGINKNGSSSFNATLNIGTPAMPEVTIGEETVENNSTVNPGELSISSQYATSILITMPDAAIKTIDGSYGLFTPLQSGTYTIVGKNSTQTSATFSFSVVIPVWRQVYTMSQLKDLTHLVIGSVADSTVMTGTDKGSGLAPADAAFANGEVTTAQAQEFVLTQDYNEIEGQPIEGQWRLITSGTQGICFGTNMNIGNASLIDYSVTAEGNAVIAPRNNTTQSIRYSLVNNNFGRYNNNVDSPVQIYRKLQNGSEVPDMPLVFAGGELLSEDSYDLAAGTEVMIVSPGATSISNGVSSASEGCVYSFTLQQSGTFTFTGINAVGNSASRSITLSIPTASTPVITVDGKTVEGTSIWIGANSTAVVTSKYAESIEVTFPDGNKTIHQGSVYSFTPIVGQYTFQGISPSGNSDPVSVTFKSKVYTLVTDASQLKAGDVYVLITNEPENAEHPNWVVEVPQGMNASPYYWYNNNEDKQVLLCGLNGDSATVTDNRAICSDNILTMTLAGEKGNWKLMTSSDKGIDVLSKPANAASGNSGTNLMITSSPTTFDIAIVDGKYAKISTNSKPDFSIRYFTSRGCFTILNNEVWSNVSLYRLADEELTAADLASFIQLGRRNPGKAVSFTGSAVVTGLYNDRLWLRDENGNSAKAQDPDGEAFSVNVNRGHAISGFCGTVSAEAPYVITFIPALTAENVSDTTLLPLPEEVIEITVGDMNRFVQMQGSATFTTDGGSLTVNGTTYEIAPMELPTSNGDRNEDNEQTAIWKPSMAWPTAALTDKYFTGYVAPGSDSSVSLLLVRITDSKIQTGVNTINMDGISIHDGIIDAPEGTHIYTPAGIRIQVGQPVPSAGIYIIVSSDGRSAKVYVK